jgi:hypothetical protein
VSDGADLGRLNRRDWPWLAGLLLVGCLSLGLFALTAHRFTGGQMGVPLDDAWIHLQFARNLARGDGFSFNPGQPTAGSTAPLWTLLLAAVYFVGGALDGAVAGPVLSAICFLAALAATYGLARRLTGERWAAGLAGAVVAVNGRMVWAGLSGLETCLFAALSLLAIRAHLGDRATLRRDLDELEPRRDRSSRQTARPTIDPYRLRTTALFALAALTRPEGYLLFALSLADHILHRTHYPSRTTHRAPRTTHHESRFTFHVSRFTSPVSRLLPPLATFTALVLPYLLFSLRTGGRLLPNTYYAKATFDFRPDLAFLSVAAQYLILDNPSLLPFYVLGLGVLLRPILPVSSIAEGPAPSAAEGPVRSVAEESLSKEPALPVPSVVEGSLSKGAPLLSLWGVGLPLVLAFLHAALYQHGRYLMPLIPCNAVIAVAGLLAARRLAQRRGWRWPRSSRPVAVLVGVLIVAATAWRLPTMAQRYAWNVDNINHMHVALGRWVAAHTPPDAVLALNDIGAIAYVSQRPVVDLAGLVTPEVVPLLRGPERDARLADFLAGRGVGYVIVFPNWFPDLAARTDLLEPVHQVTLERNTIAGGDTMVVYEAHWRR